jgi:hypothetical protein
VPESRGSLAVLDLVPHAGARRSAFDPPGSQLVRSEDVKFHARFCDESIIPLSRQALQQTPLVGRHGWERLDPKPFAASSRLFAQANRPPGRPVRSGTR